MVFCSQHMPDRRFFCGSQPPCDWCFRIVGLRYVKQKQQCIFAGRFVKYRDAMLSGSDIASALIPLGRTGDVHEIGVIPVHQCRIGKGQFVQVCGETQKLQHFSLVVQ